MSRLDAWLDGECRNMRVALMLDPNRDLRPADPQLNVENDEALLQRLDDYRNMLRRSYRGQCIAAVDAFEAVWREVPWWLRRPVEVYVRILERLTGGKR